MGDTKNITVNLPTGAASFIFTKLNPVKSEYVEGASVYVEYGVKNAGTDYGGAQIDVKDRDTSVKITSYTIPEIPPGQAFTTTGTHAYVGKMPNKNWNLTFTVTP